MRHIIIPDPVEFAHAKNNEPISHFTFTHFVETAINSNSDLTKGIVNIRKAGRIMEAVEMAQETAAESCDLEEEDWKALWNSVDGHLQLVPRLSRLCLAMYEAVEGAESVKPAKKE